MELNQELTLNNASHQLAKLYVTILAHNILVNIFIWLSNFLQKNAKKLVSLSHDEFALRSWERRWEEAEVERILKAKHQHRGKTIMYIQHVHFISKTFSRCFYIR